jgi:hypothetical protein
MVEQLRELRKIDPSFPDRVLTQWERNQEFYRTQRAVEERHAHFRAVFGPVCGLLAVGAPLSLAALLGLHGLGVEAAAISISDVVALGGVFIIGGITQLRSRREAQMWLEDLISRRRIQGSHQALADKPAHDEKGQT